MGVSTDIQKPDIDVKINGKEPSMDNLIPTADLSMQKPSIGGETPDIGVSLEGKPADLNIDASFPKVQVPELSLETEEKTSKFSLGFGKKGKKKKDKPSKTAEAEAEAKVDVPIDGSATLPKIDISIPTTGEVNIQAPDVKLDVNQPAVGVNLDAGIPAVDLSTPTPELE